MLVVLSVKIRVQLKIDLRVRNEELCGGHVVFVAGYRLARCRQNTDLVPAKIPIVKSATTLITTSREGVAEE